MTSKSQFVHPAWTLVLAPAALTAIAASPADRRLYSCAVAAVVFSAMQWLLPKSRFRREDYFSPVNIALGLMLVKLIAAPMLIMAVGATNELFIGLPSRMSMEGAVLIDIVACVALCFGVTFSPRIPGGSKIIQILSTPPAPVTILLYIAIGVAGFVLAFGTPGRLIQYFMEPASVADVTRELEGSWSGLLGVVLRPFFAFALIAWWARSVDAARRPMLVAIVAAIGITAANLTYSFNRAAFAFPVLTMVAVYSARIKRIPAFATASALAVLVPALFILGNYRAQVLAPPTAPKAHDAFETSVRETSNTIQAYAGGPALAGLFFEESKWGARPYLGLTLLSSVISPIPMLGKNFRETSGSTIYNRTLYGLRGYEDQIIPLSAELFVNFHAAGVFAGFFLLGRLLGAAEQWFSRAGSAFGAFFVQYVFTWVAMLCVWSLSVFSQIAIYFLAPIYLYSFGVEARAWLRRLRAPSLANSFS
jgi:hypothetical protein